MSSRTRKRGGCVPVTPSPSKSGTSSVTSRSEQDVHYFHDVDRLDVPKEGTDGNVNMGPEDRSTVTHPKFGVIKKIS